MTEQTLVAEKRLNDSSPDNVLSTSTAQVRAMLSMQDGMNQKVHPEWIAQKFEWYRAAWIECAELMDHLGYKWWKKQSCDEDQVRLEVVDIWHFAMSSYFADDIDLDQLAASIAAQDDAQGELERLGYSTTNWSQAQCQAIREATEALAEASLAQKLVPVSEFWKLLVATGFNLQSLYVAYVGKNVLNFFRQDHGYKTGEYKKLWQGREDNEHLSELVDTLDAGSESFRDDLYAALKERYLAA